MKKLLSYLWPFTKEVKSQVNGTLELTWINGKKVLDSQNANYSYGSLQKLLCFGLSKIEIHNNDQILLLGLGGGSIIRSLREKFIFNGKITAVEIDELIIKLAKTEFNITNSNTLEIICEDAFAYIHQSKGQFEIIIVDIFIDTQVPEQFYSLQFWNQLMKRLSPSGYILFNAGINLTDQNKIKHLILAFETKIGFTEYQKVEGANTILVGRKL
ncbi:spermidine synthase [Aquimarina pacifica]|uniref:spermidine synthase n=1 Tax=Aquimarina pacifica TaxID=1296415 RepID=UPI00047032DD|nr:fused MFS/spermidine synthase [Aquimarina pacifica]